MRGVKNRARRSWSAAIGREDEGGVGIVELARDREHLGFVETVGIQHHARRIAGEWRARERIDLMDLDTARHGVVSALLTERGAILFPAVNDLQ